MNKEKDVLVGKKFPTKDGGWLKIMAFSEGWYIRCPSVGISFRADEHRSVTSGSSFGLICAVIESSVMTSLSEA
jgi:hypothetical protein